MSGGTRCRRSTRLTVASYSERLLPTEGGVFAVADDVVVLGRDDAALLAAAEAYAARAPYIWRPSGEKIAAIGRACDPGAQISGVTYLKGKAGINRAFLNCTSDVTQSRLEEALKAGALASVHELVAMANGATVSAARSSELPAIPAAPPAAGAGARHRMRQQAATAKARDRRGSTWQRSTPARIVPRHRPNADPVHAGRTPLRAGRRPPGSRWRTLPRAWESRPPASLCRWRRRRASAAARDVRSQAVLADSVGSRQGGRTETARRGHRGGKIEPALSAGEGELHIVDKAFGRQAAVLVRGDEAGASGPRSAC